MDRIRVEHQEMERLIQDMAATLDSGDPSGDIRARVLRISQQQARIKRIIEGPGAPGSGHVDASSPQ
jgi:hypothetical protein